MKTIAFNLESFKNGKLGVNGLGQKVKFLCETRGKLQVRTTDKWGNYRDEKFNMDGKKYSGTETAWDIVGLIA